LTQKWGEEKKSENERERKERDGYLIRSKRVITLYAATDVDPADVISTESESETIRGEKE